MEGKELNTKILFLRLRNTDTGRREEGTGGGGRGGNLIYTHTNATYLPSTIQLQISSVDFVLKSLT